MKCKKVRRKLTTYLDGELGGKKKQSISEHLKICPDCKKEFNILAQQNEFLKQLETIEVSSNFRTTFWQKATCKVVPSEARNLKGLLLRLQQIAMTRKATWIPVPTMCVLLFIIVFHLFMFSFALFVRGQNLKNQITSQVVKNLFISSHPLNPVSLLNFCKGCCQSLCRCAQNQGIPSRCVCGECKK
jgi:hypothetical protein